MALNLPPAGTALTRANFADPVKVEIDANETDINTVSGVANNALTKATAAYVKPTGGIPRADTTTAVQTSLARADASNVRAIEWTGDLATVRPTADPAIVYIWIKRDPAHADPPTDATHMLAGKDLLLRATSG